MKPCREGILKNMINIYKYYVYCIYVIFTPKERRSRLALNNIKEIEEAYFALKNKTNYPRLYQYLMNIYESIRRQYNELSVSELFPTEFNEMIQLNEESSLNGANEKIVGVESYFYVFEVLQKMKGKIEVRNSLL